MQKVVKAKTGPSGPTMAAKESPGLAETGPARGTVLIAKSGPVVPMAIPLDSYQ